MGVDIRQGIKDPGKGIEEVIADALEESSILRRFGACSCGVNKVGGICVGVEAPISARAAAHPQHRIDTGEGAQFGMVVARPEVDQVVGIGLLPGEAEGGVRVIRL